MFVNLVRTFACDVKNIILKTTNVLGNIICSTIIMLDNIIF